MRQSVLVERLVDCANIAAPVKVDCGVGELDHRVSGVDIDIRYQCKRSKKGDVN